MALRCALLDGNQEKAEIGLIWINKTC